MIDPCLFIFLKLQLLVSFVVFALSSLRGLCVYLSGRIGIWQVLCVEILVVYLWLVQCGGNIRRWGLVKGSDVIGRLPLKGVLDHCLSLCLPFFTDTVSWVFFSVSYFLPWCSAPSRAQRQQGPVATDWTEPKEIWLQIFLSQQQETNMVCMGPGVAWSKGLAVPLRERLAF